MDFGFSTSKTIRNTYTHTYTHVHIVHELVELMTVTFHKNGIKTSAKEKYTNIT